MAYITNSTWKVKGFSALAEAANEMSIIRENLERIMSEERGNGGAPKQIWVGSLGANPDSHTI